MNVRVGDTVEVVHHMSNRGKVIRIYYRPVTAATGAGSFSRRKFIIFESNLDGKVYDMRAQDLRVIKE
jgi:hypothetical protein